MGLKSNEENLSLLLQVRKYPYPKILVVFKGFFTPSPHQNTIDCALSMFNLPCKQKDYVIVIPRGNILYKMGQLNRSVRVCVYKNKDSLFSYMKWHIKLLVVLARQACTGLNTFATCLDMNISNSKQGRKN